MEEREADRCGWPRQWPPSRFMSPGVGADLVAARRKDGLTGQTSTMGAVFSCEHCGGHVCRVENIVQVLKTGTGSIPCDCCGEAGAVAAIWQMDEQTAYCEWGTLRPDHGWDVDDVDVMGAPLRGFGIPDVTCEDCYLRFLETADMTALEPTDVIWTTDDADDEQLSVRCSCCGHESEFGRTRSDDGERIWPCEASNFDPSACTPEERFRDAWERRGWTRSEAEEVLGKEDV